MVKNIVLIIVWTVMFAPSAFAVDAGVVSRPINEVRVPFTASEVRTAKLLTFNINKISLTMIARQFQDATLEQVYVITESMKSYTRRRKDTCPCPYNLASDDTLCGARSARAKPNGEKPICYPEDVASM